MRAPGGPHAPVMESGPRTTPTGPSGLASAPATVLHAGERIVLVTGSFTIGRLPDNDLAIAEEAVSRYHARIEAAGQPRS